ncbi:MAG: SRPBCC domain-containing protein [Sandaracinaceae bacterium]
MIRRELEVPLSIERAFALFTERVDAWWPSGHRVSGEDESVMALELGPDGRLFERTRSGREIVYARIVALEAPRLITYDWFLGTGPDMPTRVEVRFSPTDRGTRVEIAHGPGACEPDRFERSAPRFVEGWRRIAEALSARALADLDT